MLFGMPVELFGMIGFFPFAYLLFSPVAFLLAIAFYFLYFAESKRDRAYRLEEEMADLQARALGRILDRVQP